MLRLGERIADASLSEWRGDLARNAADGLIAIEGDVARAGGSSTGDSSEDTSLTKSSMRSDGLAIATMEVPKLLFGKMCDTIAA